jgi:hypothetical protein
MYVPQVEGDVVNPFKLLPSRRLELLLATALVAGLLLLVWINRKGAAVSSNLVLTLLEVLLPPMLGIIAAGLLANDPAIDLLLSVPQPAPRTLTYRLLILLGYGAIMNLIALWLVHLWKIELPIIGMRQSLIWLTPVLAMTGLASAAALVRGRMLDGMAAVLALWGVSIVLLPLVIRLCDGAGTQRCALALAHPMMTTMRPNDPNWLLNRALWLGIGGASLIIGLWLARREEQLAEGARGGDA